MNDNTLARLSEVQKLIEKAGGNFSVSGVFAQMLEIGTPTLRKKLVKLARVTAKQHRKHAAEWEQEAKKISRR